MNTELKQISDIVIRARKALYDGHELIYRPDVLSILFEFTPKTMFHKPVAVASVQGWFRLCKVRDLEDIQMLVPDHVQRKDLLGFANTSQGVIICYWKNGKSFVFYPSWIYDREHKGWSVVYREHRCKINKPSYTDETEAFKSVLLDIKKLALDIEQPYFAQVFQDSYEALCSNSLHNEDMLPKHFQGIYYAVSKADVFGAMGSWNDSPWYYAQKNNLKKEYDELSDKLYSQLRLNLMYIVNECWK